MPHYASQGQHFPESNSIHFYISLLNMKFFTLCMSALALSLQITATPTRGEEGVFRLPPNSKNSLYVHSVDTDGNAGLEYLALINGTSGDLSFTNATGEYPEQAKAGGLLLLGNLHRCHELGGRYRWPLGHLQLGCSGQVHISSLFSYQLGSAIAYGYNYGAVGRTVGTTKSNRFYQAQA